MAWTTSSAGVSVWAVSTAGAATWAESSLGSASWGEDLQSLDYDDDDYYDSATDDYDRTTEDWSVASTNTTTWLVIP